MKWIKAPTLLIDREKCLGNIREMVKKADNSGVRFRPHFKTHQSADIGHWFRDEGVTAITVSSLKMASYFAKNGWDDILIAFPLNSREALEINDLSGKVDLSIVTVYPENLIQSSDKFSNRMGIWIEIDTGNHRTGLDPDNYTTIKRILGIIDTSPPLYFKGFISHAGHTYQAASKSEITSIHQLEMIIMLQLKSRYLSKYPDLEISVGDTPSCSIMESFSGMDEIRPGNFVFYDVMQQYTGSCSEDQIAICLACPVVAVHSGRSELIVHGGGIHLSKEFIVNSNGNRIYGQVVKLNEKGWGPGIQGAYVSSLSQEHGVIKLPITVFNEFKIGDLIGILPIHSCMTANLMGEYFSIDGSIFDGKYD